MRLPKRPGIVFVIGILLLSISSSPVFAKGFISDSMEVSIGQQYHNEIVQKNGGEWYNPQVLSHVQEIGQRIVSVCGRTNILYRFTLVNSSDFNACSLPGGFVYVSRGAIERLENDAQLACLLGHEVSHISRKHCVTLLEQQMGINTILNVVGMVAGSQSAEDRKKIEAITNVGSVVVQIAQNGYGRTKELEADIYGAQYAAAAGYDPGGMLQILYMLQEKEGRGDSAFGDIFSTHPAPAKRIENIKVYLAEAYASPSAASYKDNFYPKEYTAEVAQTPQNDRAYEYYDVGMKFFNNGVYDIAFLKFQQALACDPTFADAHDALGTILLQQGLYDDAIYCYNQAIKYGQKAIYYNNLGSVYYYKREFQNAITCLENAIKISPDYSQAYANMAASYRGLNDYTRATGCAEKAVRLAPDNYFARSVLAVVYEERGWKEDAIREYQVLLESPEFRDMAQKKLSALRRM